METKIDNIITYANLLTVTKSIIKSIGFEYIVPLDDETVDEIVSSQVMKCVKESIGEVNA